ncbi:hypothetical protein MAR_004016 [Mya arenaria]|uniref:Uncharacterized protein n=1 Tax=Mya arenaria TaxID=6604 RepID=A0ABY7EZ35_MYAAR|nr:hypothetical protein MAR_004016 [Mya arenaria]
MHYCRSKKFQPASQSNTVAQGYYTMTLNPAFRTQTLNKQKKHKKTPLFILILSQNQVYFLFNVTGSIVQKCNLDSLTLECLPAERKIEKD